MDSSHNLTLVAGGLKASPEKLKQLFLAQKEQLLEFIDRFKHLAEQGCDAVMELDGSGVILRTWSARSSELIGLSRGALVGMSFKDLLHPANLDAYGAAMEAARHGAAHVSFQAKLFRLDALPIWVEARLSPFTRAKKTDLSRFIITLNDVTKWKDAEDRLVALSTKDALTGLSNRTLLNERLSWYVDAAKSANTTFAVLLLDLDGFKRINDTLGHSAGDALLQAVSSRLQRVLRQTDTLARTGGDEFVICLPPPCSQEQAQTVAQKIVEALRAPFEIANRSLYISTSLGVVIFPEHGTSEEVLVQNADAAMYKAKAKGRDTWCLFSPELFSEERQKLSIEDGLRRAMLQGDLELYFQPISDAKTLSVLGAEALMRWRNSDGTYVPPSEFIPVAEESGLIGRMGDWALKAACHEIINLQVAGGPSIYVSVNVSPYQFQDPGFVDSVRCALSMSGLPPHRLMLEITEGLLMEDPHRAEFIIKQLSDLGCQIAIDDFGTGYSSLAYLKKFSITSLKVDRSFVSDALDNTNSSAIVSAIMGLAHALGLSVIAEGVETADQQKFLVQRECDRIQGWLVGKAVPMSTLIGQFLNKQLS